MGHEHPDSAWGGQACSCLVGGTGCVGRRGSRGKTLCSGSLQQLSCPAPVDKGSPPTDPGRASLICVMLWVLRVPWAWRCRVQSARWPNLLWKVFCCLSGCAGLGNLWIWWGPKAFGGRLLGKGVQEAVLVPGTMQSGERRLVAGPTPGLCRLPQSSFLLTLELRLPGVCPLASGGP